MNEVFLDAAYAIALSAPSDQYHERADLRARFGANGRAAAREYFNRDEIAERFFELLERLTGCV